MMTQMTDKCASDWEGTLLAEHRGQHCLYNPVEGCAYRTGVMMMQQIRSVFC